VRFIDTGSRDPKQALGTWLNQVLIKDTSVVSVRVQTGFFGSAALGYFEPTLHRLTTEDGVTRILIGSNDGQTLRSALEDLLAIAGPPRGALSLGVVSFSSGFFHPKVFHFERADGSAAAYVGSANLTAAGVASKHVESGIILDTKEGDPHKVLTSISDAIDAWFAASPDGFYPFSASADLDALVAASIIDVTPAPPPARTPSQPKSGKAKGTGTVSLDPLIKIPPATKAPATGVTAATSASVSPPAAPAPTTPAPVQPPTVVQHWSKPLSASDAQRKGAGNQRGAVTLVQGDYRGQIDQRTYFRNVLFQNATWTPEVTATGQPMDRATIPMDTTVNGVHLGLRDFQVTYASNREAAQNNYTSTLHLEPLTPDFQQTDMTGRRLEIEQLSDGTFRLTIS
jgi:hypothetical protein